MTGLAIAQLPVPAILVVLVILKIYLALSVIFLEEDSVISLGHLPDVDHAEVITGEVTFKYVCG